MISARICGICWKRLLSTSKRNFEQNLALLINKQPSILSSRRLLSNSTSRLRKAEYRSTDTESLLHLRYLYVHTSLGRWEDVPDGILFDVGYGDSMPDKEWTPATPIVLALHPTPGSHGSLEPVIQPFVKMGCRVIAPNFPGTDYTDGISAAFTDVFNHSTDEKAEFIRDFLVTLGVERVDCVVGVGAACYPILRLATTSETKEMFKSAVMISPWPHREFRGLEPYRLFTTISFLWDRPFLRFLCRILSLAAKRSLNLQKANFKEVVLTSRTVTKIGFDEIAGGLIAAEVLRFPMVLMYSEDDPLIESELYHEFHDLLGIGNDHVTCVNEEGKIKTRATVQSYPYCFQFDKGGQELHLRYPGLINAVSWELMKHVRPNLR